LIPFEQVVVAVAAYWIPEKNSPPVGELTCTVPVDEDGSLELGVDVEVELELLPFPEDGNVFCDVRLLEPAQPSVQMSKASTASSFIRNLPAPCRRETACDYAIATDSLRSCGQKETTGENFFKKTPSARKIQKPLLQPHTNIHASTNTAASKSRLLRTTRRKLALTLALGELGEQHKSRVAGIRSSSLVVSQSSGAAACLSGARKLAILCVRQGHAA
jgi:hypothetical protein